MRPFRNVARPPPPGMRTSPYFRALDGMLVGTMAIPVNNGPVAGVSPSGPSLQNSLFKLMQSDRLALHRIAIPTPRPSASTASPWPYT